MNAELETKLAEYNKVYKTLEELETQLVSIANQTGERFSIPKNETTYTYIPAKQYPDGKGHPTIYDYFRRGYGYYYKNTVYKDRYNTHDDIPEEWTHEDGFAGWQSSSDFC